MSAPEIKGWCPGAHRPMMSGDGLVVRVRPRLARLTAAQAVGLCEAAQRHGNGTIDLTNRANLQLRGVAEGSHEMLLDDLAALDLLDREPGLESRRNILVQPFHDGSDLTARLARDLIARLRDLPPLPAKFGFAIDAGTTRCLAGNSADIRLETGCDDRLILRADGQATGCATTPDTAIDDLLELARWFAANSDTDHRRMAQLVRKTPLPASWTGAAPAAIAPDPMPGATPIGPLLGAPFGQLPAGSLADLIQRSGATALRVTPWRLFLLEDAAPTAAPCFVTHPDDPLLVTDACAGAPFCPQATVTTREIARLLATRAQGSLHVSGCAKGCARPRPATVTLVGRDGRFDLVRDGCAWDEPSRHGLTADDLQALMSDPDAL